jgi:replication factor C subunit 2/4
MTKNPISTDLRYSQIPWTEKYRPTNMDELFLPSTLKDKLISIITSKTVPNIILSGPPGIGKSSAIKIVAQKLYGNYYKDAVSEINVSDDRGIEFMRSEIVSFCKTQIPYRNGDEDNHPQYKLIIFDEADNIIKRIQDQISNIIEKFTNKVKVIFTCNSSSEISEVIQTKCFIWRCMYLDNELIVEKLSAICQKENVKYDDEVLEKIAQLSRGDMRNAINKLQMLYNSNRRIKLEHVEQLCDMPQEVIIRKLFDYIINKNFKQALKVAFDLKNNSYSGSDIMLGMMSTIRSEICFDISEEIKMKLCKGICSGIYQISNVTDSDLQLTGCLVEMVRNI